MGISVSESVETVGSSVIKVDFTNGFNVVNVIVDMSIIDMSVIAIVDFSILDDSFTVIVVSQMTCITVASTTIVTNVTGIE